MSFFQNHFLKKNLPICPQQGELTAAAEGRGRGPTGPGPGPARAQKSNPKSIFLGICGISEASNRPVSMRLAELVCLLFFRGLRNPSGTKIDKKYSKRTNNHQKPSKSPSFTVQNHPLYIDTPVINSSRLRCVSFVALGQLQLFHQTRICLVGLALSF